MEQTTAAPSVVAPAIAGLMAAVAEPPAAAMAGRGRSRGRQLRTIFRSTGSAVLVVAIFGFALPHFASYRSVWASMQAMPWTQVLLVAVAAVASMATTWIMICAVLPSIRLREAAVVNVGSNAVANTLPAGGALAMGVSWAMLSSWGVSTAGGGGRKWTGALQHRPDRRQERVADGEHRRHHRPHRSLLPERIAVRSHRWGRQRAEQHRSRRREPELEQSGDRPGQRAAGGVLPERIAVRSHRWGRQRAEQHRSRRREPELEQSGDRPGQRAAGGVLPERIAV